MTGAGSRAVIIAAPCQFSSRMIDMSKFDSVIQLSANAFRAWRKMGLDRIVSRPLPGESPLQELQFAHRQWVVDLAARRANSRRKRSSSR